MSFNFSSLFSNNSNTFGSTNWFSDWYSIKNGSYGKLMKAYYNTPTSSNTTAASRKSRTSDVVDQIIEEKKNPKVSEETQAANEHLSTAISTLKNTVTTLQNANTYTASEDGTSAAEKVVSAVKNYVSQYNDTVKTAQESTLANKTAHVAGMMRSSQTNADKLAEIGITVNSDGTLQLNEDKLKATDISKVQDLFSKDNVISYGSTVMSRLGFASVSSGSVKSTEKETEKQDNTVYEGASSLKTDIEKLTSGSLFEKVKGEDGKTGYDIEKIFSAAKSFVGNYNRMLESAGSSFNSGVMSNLASILEKTEKNKSALKEFGISVDNKGRMKIDEDTFKNADMSKVQKFFKDYGSSISSNVSLVNYYMTTQADASNGYTPDGMYNPLTDNRYNTFV